LQGLEGHKSSCAMSSLSNVLNKRNMTPPEQTCQCAENADGSFLSCDGSILHFNLFTFFISFLYSILDYPAIEVKGGHDGSLGNPTRGHHDFGGGSANYMATDLRVTFTCCSEAQRVETRHVVAVSALSHLGSSAALKDIKVGTFSPQANDLPPSSTPAKWIDSCDFSDTSPRRKLRLDLRLKLRTRGICRLQRRSAPSRNNGPK
jgi:hypothetical protein